MIETANVTLEDLLIQNRINSILTIEQKINSIINPAEKVRLQQIVVDSLTGIYRSYPEHQMIKSKLSNAYGGLAWFYLFTEQFQEAAFAAEKGLDIDPAQEWIHTNLALGLLLQGKKSEAMEIYKQFKGKPYDDQRSWNEVFLSDIQELEKAGIRHEDVSEIKAFLHKE